MEENSKNIEIPYGKTSRISFNIAVKYEIEFEKGTTISGIIPANSPMKVCQQGDIVGFKIFAGEYLNQDLSIVS